MQTLRLPSFQAIGAGLRSTSQVQNLPLSIGRILLKYGGAMTLANITEIQIKIGARTVFGPVSGPILDKINKYKGIPAQTGFLALDFNQLNALSAGTIEEGAIDIRDLRNEPIFIEVTNNLAPGSNFTLEALGQFMAPQVRIIPKDKDGNGGSTQRQINDMRKMYKLMQVNIPLSGSRSTWPPVFRGADIIRIHFDYSQGGTNWTSTTDGHIQNIEIKKNGVTIHDRITCMENRFEQVERKLVPQPYFYTWDPCRDSIFQNTVETEGASFMFDLTMANGNIPVTAWVECYDTPFNL